MMYKHKNSNGYFKSYAFTISKFFLRLISFMNKIKTIFPPLEIPYCNYTKKDADGCYYCLRIRTTHRRFETKFSFSIPQI